MNRYIIDRIEENFYVCESDDDFVNIPISTLKANVGDVLYCIDGNYKVDKEETNLLRAKNIELQNKLFGLNNR